jgi:hypothetical protein
MRRALDPNTTTPLWQSEKLRVAAKQNGPIYSIDKLFTDKELSMTYNVAALAAHKYILRNRANGTGTVSSPDGSDEGLGDGLDNGDGESVPSAAVMERSVSHATRSTRGGANQHFIDEKLGVESISNFELPANLDLYYSQEPPKLPPYMPSQYMKPYTRTTEHNVPAPLTQDDTSADMMVINIFKQYDQLQGVPGSCLDAPNGLRKTLELAAIPYSHGRYAALTQSSREDPENLRTDLGLPAGQDQDDAMPPQSSLPVPPIPSAAPLALTAVPMSRNSSLGGVPMSRQGTGGSGRGKGRKT